MTNKDAIAYGKRVIKLGLNDETQAFCEMAIKALKQETSNEWHKTIRAAIYAAFEMKSRGTIMFFTDMKEEITWDEVIVNLIENLPPEMQDAYKPQKNEE